MVGNHISLKKKPPLELAVTEAAAAHSEHFCTAVIPSLVEYRPAAASPIL